MKFTGGKAKVTLGRIIDDETITEVTQVLEKYGDIPLHLFTSIFSSFHGKLLDAASLGFDDGLFGFFREISEYVQLSDDGLIRLIAQQTNGIGGQRKKSSRLMIQRRLILRRYKNVFDEEDTFLWPDAHRYLLKIKSEQISIAKSHLEMALIRSYHEISREMVAIHQALVKHDDGILLHEFINIYQFRNKQRLFSETTTDFFTDDYPEIFYRVEGETYGGRDALIFDGKTRTIDDLTGKSIPGLCRNPSKICLKFVMSGLYQKTLILIREAGPEGLKLAVWLKSMEMNKTIFKLTVKTKDEERLLNMQPLVLFLILASERFVEIRSHKDSKNDLRIFFPPSAIDLESYFKSAKRSNGSDGSSTLSS